MLIQFLAVEDLQGNREDFAEINLFNNVDTDPISGLTYIQNIRSSKEMCIRLQDLGPLKVIVKDPQNNVQRRFESSFVQGGEAGNDEGEASNDDNEKVVPLLFVQGLLGVLLLGWRNRRGSPREV